MNFENPLIVQTDRTLLLDVHAPLAEECRDALIPFAELIKSPEHLHTYQVTPLSLWNAASAGFSSDMAIETLKKYSRYDVPQSVEVWVKDTAERFGKLRLVPGPVIEVENGVKEEYLYLVSSSPFVFKEIESNAFSKKFLVPCEYEMPSDSKTDLSENEKKFCFKLNLTDRGIIKQNLIKIGWPVKDDVPLVDGAPLEINLREETLSGKNFGVREYQQNAAASLVGDKGPGTGFGTIVLPCGAGKTIVGMQLMSILKTNTLIVTTNISAVHQWIDELMDKTNLTRDQIAEYTGESKSIKPVTVATYQILTWRPEKDGPYPHFSLFRSNNWGLIIYDEVHMLPAPVFRVAAELQAVRRVGLTATLIREDGCEGHVFSLVGPKRFDVPWKELEKSRWIATAQCIEVRIPLEQGKEIEYAVAGNREKHRIASENNLKLGIVKELVEKCTEDKILVIGQYLKQLNEIAAILKVPIVTGKTPNSERDRIFADFRNGSIKVLVVSKVANFAIDLPDASMAIQVSGTFGSRQEEAQRLGRILRPKERTSRFFTLITKDTVEEEFGNNRQKFLAEQGYSYRIIRYENSTSFDELDVKRID
ncbi:MAG: DNA repair helicase XPB [Treponema sp.]|nr:DNA repair helicase XPB [Treponema sp.]